MRAWEAQEFGEPIETLKMVDRTLPEPEGTMIEVKVSAAGIGLPDVLMFHSSIGYYIHPRLIKVIVDWLRGPTPETERNYIVR